MDLLIIIREKVNFRSLRGGCEIKGEVAKEVETSYKVQHAH